MSSGEPAWICCAPRSRSAQNRGSDAPPLLLRAAKTARAARRAARARDLSRRVGRSAVRRAAGKRPASLLDVSRAARAAPVTHGPAASVRSAAGRLRAAVHRRTRGGGARARAGGDRVRRRRGLRGGSAPLGMAGDDAAAVVVWDYETCLAAATREVQLARDSGALDGARSRASTCWARRSRWAATSRRRLRWSPRPMRSHEATGARGDAVRRPGARRVPRPGGRGLRPDRRHHQGRHGRGPGNRGPIRTLGDCGRRQRPRPLRGGARGGQAGERGHTRSCSFPRGR